MCGIFGFSGIEKKAPRIIINGLKDLEYRGYDSWGVAVTNGSKKQSNLKVEKHVGKIGEGKNSLPSSNCGIGHTRWATHGGGTTANAHPHLSCQGDLALIHNGIVENYLVLRSKLKHHRLLSGTDTEIIVHLIEEEKNKGANLLEATKRTFLKLKGLNAIVLLSNNGQIITVKNGTPLVLGIGKNENFLASDPSALLPHTKKVIFLEDNNIASLTAKGWQIFDLNGRKKQLKIRRLDWKIESAKLEGYRHFMIKEIHEQPKVIRNIAKNYSKQIGQLSKIIKEARGTFFIGCGSASYAALAGQYLFSKIANLHVNFSIGSEFNYLEHYLNKNSLIIALSQSGETIDVVEPAVVAKKRRVKVVVLTNVLGSTLYRLADYKIPLGAGPEKAVAATKSFIAMVSILIFLVYQMNNEGNSAKEILIKAAGNIEEMLKDKYLEKIRKLANKIYHKEHVYIIGRGLSYAAALEATLKLKEVSYIHSEGFAGGELKHGVIALIEKGTPTIVFVPNDETKEAILSNAIEIKSRGGYIIGVGPANNEVFDYYLPTSDVAEASVIVNTVPAQLLAYYIALKKNLDPDMPRNLAKSVTVR